MQGRRQQFKIDDMDCAEEVAVLKRELAPIVGGEDCLSFDLLNRKLTIADCPADIDSNQILAAIQRTGMSAAVWDNSAKSNPNETRLRIRTILTVVCGVLAIIGFVVHWSVTGHLEEALGAEGLGQSARVPIAAGAVYSLSILCGAWFVFPRAWLALRQLRPDMNLLMLIAIIGAAVLGDWFEAATVAFLFSVSLILEKWSVDHARRSIDSLLDLAPPVARLLLPDGRQVELTPAQVTVGARLLVKPGESFPLDGRVLSGRSHVNQANITGESLPVSKSVGDQVFAGTINGEGALEIECTRLSDATTMARLIQMVSESYSRRSQSEQWVEKFARVYTPIILVLSGVILVVPPLLLHESWSTSFYRALVLLVISCPCALVISTPVSVVAAIAAAARRGVLIKGGAFVEVPARIRAMAFDKTGTLTEGTPAVVGVYPLNGCTEAELIEQVASLEARSEHPLGKAVMHYATERNVPIRAVDDFQTVPGMGATGRIARTLYWLGSQQFLQKRGFRATDFQNQINGQPFPDGASLVFAGDDKGVSGVVALADRIRPEACSAIKSLQSAGIKPIVMVTGDNQSTARAVARTLGIDAVHAELLPADKVTAIEDLVRRTGCVAMVGDGVNDAPAMARASLGIAVKAATGDVAMNTADIALMSSDLNQIPWLIAHSRRTLRIIGANVALSLAIKLIFVVLTFTGTCSLWAAIAADMGASLIVIFNGLRLLKPTSDSIERH